MVGLLQEFADDAGAACAALSTPTVATATAATAPMRVAVTMDRRLWGVRMKAPFAGFLMVGLNGPIGYC
jgi:hypothetical protein